MRAAGGGFLHHEDTADVDIAGEYQKLKSKASESLRISIAIVQGGGLGIDNIGDDFTKLSTQLRNFPAMVEQNPTVLFCQLASYNTLDEYPHLGVSPIDLHEQAAIWQVHHNLKTN